MISKHKLPHDDTAVRVELPQHLGIKTMDGRLKAGTVLIDDVMANLIQTLWYRYEIGTVGSCKGYSHKKLSGLPWIQIGSNVDYPDWVVNLVVKETIRVLDEISDFPVVVYDPKCTPNVNPRVYISSKWYGDLVKRGCVVDIPVIVIQD